MKKKKTKSFCKGDTVYLLCAKTDLGEEPAIDLSSVGFLSAEVVSDREKDEDGNFGFWLKIETYDAFYEERFLLTREEYDKYKVVFGK